MQPPDARPAPALTARIVGFLRRYPPFSYLPAEALRALCERVVVQYLPPHATVFAQGDAPQEGFYVVRKGAVRLFRASEGGARLVDQLDEGDVFGMRPLIASQPYGVTARAHEESLLYVVPLAAFEPLLDRYPSVSRFLATSFAAGVRNPAKPASAGRALAPETADVFAVADAARREQLTDLTRVTVSRSPLTCAPDTSLRSAAEAMTRAGIGSIVAVDEAGRPVGIVTDRDMRRSVVTGLFDADDDVAQVMSAPVATIAPDRRVVDVQLEMLRRRVHHLVVTTDGTPATRVLGVIGNRDLLLALGSSPAAVVAEVEHARDGETLRALRARAELWLRPIVDQRGSMYAAAAIMTEINDAITRRCVELALERCDARGIAEPPLPFCWLSLGSQGRGEQLLRTDQDHAIVMADGPAAEVEAARAACVAIADEASALLAEVGFERCVGDMMAANPAWCLTLAEWRAQLGEWLQSPTGEHVLNAATLLDRRPVYGDRALGEALVADTARRVQGERLFLAFLAKAAIDNPPPLSFFRQFVVEKGGGHDKEFDIKQRAMLPLADAARVLSLELGVSDPPNTVGRFDRLRGAEPQNADLYLAAAQAYDTLMLFRARQGMSDESDGRYFKIRELSKLERLQLRNAFRPAEELLTALRLRFQVSMLNQ